MRRSRALAGLLLLALTMMAAPVHAVDPALAGVFRLTATTSGAEEPETLFLTVMLKGSEVVLLVLTPGSAAPWYFGVTELTGTQVEGTIGVTGTMLDSNGDPLGPFDLLLTLDKVEGTLTNLFLDRVTVTGERYF